MCITPEILRVQRVTKPCVFQRRRAAAESAVSPPSNSVN